MEERSKISDKVIFTVSFLALLLALSPYKTELNNIKLTYFTIGITLYNSLLIIAAILFGSVYFSAIENLKSISWLSDWKVPEIGRKIADVLYFFAIAGCPLLIVLSSTSSILTAQVLKYTNSNAENIHGTFMFFGTLIILFPTYWKPTKRWLKLRKLVKELEKHDKK